LHALAAYMMEKSDKAHFLKNLKLQREIGDKEDKIQNLELALRQKETLSQSKEAQYQKLAEEISDVLFTLNGEGMITYMSPAVQQLTGRMAGEYLGSHLLFLIHPDDYSSLMTNLRKLGDGDHIQEDYMIKTKSGATAWVRIALRKKFATAIASNINVWQPISPVAKRRRKSWKKPWRTFIAATKSPTAAVGNTT
jgi:PAS domain S-box-containing protein